MQRTMTTPLPPQPSTRRLLWLCTLLLLAKVAHAGMGGSAPWGTSSVRTLSPHDSLRGQGGPSFHCMK